MATKSMLKSVYIKNKKAGHQLVEAMERAYKADDHEVVLSKSFSVASKEEVKKLFEHKEK